MSILTHIYGSYIYNSIKQSYQNLFIQINNCLIKHKKIYKYKLKYFKDYYLNLFILMMNLIK